MVFVVNLFTYAVPITILPYNYYPSTAIGHSSRIMKATIDLTDEQKRLNALRDYHVVDTENEPAFDAVTKLVASICHAPMAMISLITEDRQWFKSKLGTDVSEIPRELAFCAYAIQDRQLM